MCQFLNSASDYDTNFCRYPSETIQNFLKKKNLNSYSTVESVQSPKLQLNISPSTRIYASIYHNMNYKWPGCFVEMDKNMGKINHVKLKYQTKVW